MARQIVDIGLEGNDNTGDSIRESFRKVNENFNELYAVFGLGGQLSITDMNDVPEYDTGNKVLAVNKTANGINFLELVSDSAINPNTADSIGFQYSDDGTKLIVKQLSSKVANDTAPRLAGPLNGAGIFPIANIAVNQAAVNLYNAVHNPTTPITIDKLVITKEYADRNYLTKSAPGGGTRIGDEPATPDQYTVSTTQAISGNNLIIPNHGLGIAYTGAPFVFKSSGTDPNGLDSGNTYYIRVVSENEISLHLTQVDAESGTNKVLISGGTGTFSLTDGAFDPTLMGNWLSNEALPRKSIVRRQGDRMEGPLYLHDHPGDLSGNEYDNLEDLQAATKLYVDSVSSSSQVNLFVKTDGDDSQERSPFGKEGRSQSYAYKTIGAAARKAEELIFSAPVEPGPYMQTITHSNKTVNSVVNSIVFTNSSVPTRVNARTIIIQNKKFLQKEAVLYIKDKYPQFEFDEETCERDIGLILEAVSLDIISGNNANTLSRTAAIRYFSSPTSKRSVTTYRTQTLDVHEYLKDLIVTNILPSVLKTNTFQNKYTQKVNPSLSIDPQASAAVVGKFDLIDSIITNGIFSGGIIDGQNTYKVYITNNNGSVDQGIISNTDIIPGKLLRGKTSGALGKIISYTRGVDNPVVPGTDQVELQLIEPIEFILGEELEFGSVAQTTQITINVESGIYYEDYPIRVSPNVSVNGDEFRRVIVRPKNRVSQSPYANTYFYRDKEFDNLNLFADKESNPLAKGLSYVNPITNTVDGYFGYHYLTDSRTVSNTGNVYENSGNWFNAYKAITANKDFIIEQGVKYFETSNPLITDYDDVGLVRYLESVVTSIAKDLLAGGKEFSLEAQGNFWKYAVEENITAAATGAVNYVGTLIKRICNVQNPTTYYGTNLSYPANKWPDLSYGSAEPAVWSAETQYLRNSVVRVLSGGVYKYYKSRIVHTSGASFTTTEKNTYWNEIEGIANTVDNLAGTIVFAYDADYNPPKHNKEMDAFLMNDSTILRNITVQGHGGFMCVLDPQGQILNKSPYIQTGSSFSQSLNKQAFRGGMFIDGFVGNLSMKVTGKVSGSNFRLIVQSDGSPSNPQGLFIRRPETPCSFYIEGRRFQVNAITNYDQAAGTAELILDRTSNEGNGFTGTAIHYGTNYNLGTLAQPVPIVLQTAGNRSMLGNDFTQINDLGYGLVCVNGALSEMVSMFTYYCHAGYYAKSGSEIRSLTGSTCYGEYGLISEGADPNEIPDDIVLVNDMLQPARIFESESILYLNNSVSVSKDDTITQTRVINGVNVVITGKAVITTENSPVVYVKDIQNGAFDTTNIIYKNVTTSLGTAYEIDAESYKNTLASLALYSFDMKDVPLSNSELDVYHPVRNIVGRYEVRNVAKTDAVVGKFKEINNKIATVAGAGGLTGSGATFSIEKTRLNGYKATIENPGSGYSVGNQFVVRGNNLGGLTPGNDATITVTEVSQSGSVLSVTTTGTINVDNNTPYFSGQVYRLNFSRSDAQFSTLGLLEEVNWYTDNIPTTIEYRRNENHIVSDIENPETLTIRPSTALLFKEYDQVYRTISFTQQDSVGNELASDTVQVSFDSPFDYIKLNVDSTKIAVSDTNNVGRTLGSQVGDLNIAIRPVTEPSAIVRLNNTPRMLFAWKGAKYQVYNYREVFEGGATEPTYAIVSISKVEDILNSGVGLSVPLDLTVEQITLRVGLAANSAGDITFNISTCRATGHDFLDVGKGGYNESNFPNVIFGQAANTNISEGTNEVTEVGKGRVFYVSTDQNGVFRVGRFFTVDQGTGTVSFAASIALNDIDGIGFKRGVTVSEFSTDSAMSDNDENTVPVESAVRGFVNRRLGFNNDGRLVSNVIGPGVMSLGGPGKDQTPMKGDMNLGGYKITNVADPGTGEVSETDAANRRYVDLKISNTDELSELLDVDLTNPTSASLLTFTGTNFNSVNASVTGNVTFTLSGNTLTSSIAAGSIVNSMIDENAAIAQRKLALSNASADIQADAVKGITSFDSTFFTTASGWTSLKDNGITFGKLATVASGTLLGRTATGSGNLSAVTFDAVMSSVGAVLDSDFNTTVGNAVDQGDALIKTGAGAYAVTNITKTGETNSIVKTDSNGKIQVKSIILGGDSSYEVLALSGSSTVLKTPAQGEILSSEGGSATVSPTVTLPGSVIIGSGNASISTLQSSAAAAIKSSSRLKVDWIHTSFIEASGEKDASSTGIAIGASTGKTNEGEIGIVTANLVTNTSVMPFKFTSSGVVPDVTVTYDIGSETRQYKNVWAETFNGTATSAYYADLAENYLADAEYEPGTVLVFGGSEEVTVLGEKGTHRVAGVVSTNPAHLMNSMLKGKHVSALALQGRVPCKVVGSVKKGDLLVNSGIPGYACVDNNARAGTIVGKSLEDKADSNKGVIEIVVGKH